MSQIRWNPELAIGDVKISERMVMKSAAGYYIGRYCEEDGIVMPFMRETGYSATEGQVQTALVTKDYVLRTCMENEAVYSTFPNMKQAK